MDTAKPPTRLDGVPLDQLEASSLVKDVLVSLLPVPGLSLSSEDLLRVLDQDGDNKFELSDWAQLMGELAAKQRFGILSYHLARQFLQSRSAQTKKEPSVIASVPPYTIEQLHELFARQVARADFRNIAEDVGDLFNLGLPVNGQRNGNRTYQPWVTNDGVTREFPNQLLTGLGLKDLRLGSRLLGTNKQVFWLTTHEPGDKRRTTYFYKAGGTVTAVLSEIKNKNDSELKFYGLGHTITRKLDATSTLEDFRSYVEGLCQARLWTDDLDPNHRGLVQTQTWDDVVRENLDTTFEPAYGSYLPTWGFTAPAGHGGKWLADLLGTRKGSALSLDTEFSLQLKMKDGVHEVRLTPREVIEAHFHATRAYYIPDTPKFFGFGNGERAVCHGEDRYNLVLLALKLLPPSQWGVTYPTWEGQKISLELIVMKMREAFNHFRSDYDAVSSSHDLVHMPEILVKYYGTKGDNASLTELKNSFLARELKLYHEGRGSGAARSEISNLAHFVASLGHLLSAPNLIWTEAEKNQVKQWINNVKGFVLAHPMAAFGGNVDELTHLLDGLRLIEKHAGKL